MTKRLYFEDSYAREFEAEVVETSSREGKPAVALDQTCFYPESGGQPSDRGVLDGVRVVHVLEEGEKLVHILEGELGSARVRGAIDWPRRFDHMQQHSGQHILSQCFLEVAEGETRSFHLGELSSTLEIGRPDISGDDLEKIEGRANQVIFEDREIKTYFVSGDEIAAVPFRRPPRKEGTLRVVEISGFDYSACGGTHCRRTGEIGLLKIVKVDKIRGNLRFEFLCGRRALRDYGLKHRAVQDISRKFSVQEEDSPAAVERALEEARRTRKKTRQLQEELAGYEARDMTRNETGGVVRKAWPDKSAEEAKLLALNIIRRGAWVALFAASGDRQNHLVFASSERLRLSMRELLSDVLPRVSGRGGGSASLAEAVVDKGADLEAVLEAAEAWVRARLS